MVSGRKVRGLALAERLGVPPADCQALGPKTLKINQP